MGNVGSMVVALLANTSDFDKKMGTSTKKVDKFQAGVQKMGKAITKAAKLAAAAAAAAVVAFGVSAVKTFVDFDTGMREVFTLMPELSAEAREAMEEDVKSLSAEIGILPTEVIPALYQAISAGVPRENVFSFLEIAGKASIGGITSLEVAVGGLAAVTNAYGDEVISVEEVADIMFTTVKEGVTTFEELSARLFQAVPVAAAVGLEFHNVAAAAAQITLSGVPMRVAMTQIRSLINEVAFEGKELNKVFQEASGMTFPEFVDSGGDIADIIEILQGAADLAGISIAELTANLEAQGALLNLSGVKLDNLRGILVEMSVAADAHVVAYEEMAAGIKRQLDKIATWWELLRIDIGDELTASLQDLLGWLETNQEAIGGGIKAIFDGLIDGLDWLQRNAAAVKTGLITISVGLGAIVLASAGLPQLVVALAALIALMGDVPSGFSDEFKDLAPVFDPNNKDSITSYVYDYSKALLAAMGTMEIFKDGATASFNAVYDDIRDLQDEVLGMKGTQEELSAAWIKGLDEILAKYVAMKGGLEVLEALRIGHVLSADAAEENAESAIHVADTITTAKDAIAEVNRLLAEYREDQEAAAAATIETAEAIALTTDDIEKAEKSFADLSTELKNTEKGGLDYIVVVGKIQSEYANLIAASKAVGEQDEETTERLRELIALYELLGIELDDSVDDVEAWGAEYRSIISSTMSDALWSITTALADEELSYEETMTSINDIVKDGFADMVNSIIQSGIDTATDWVVTQLWNMATGAELASAATSTALSTILLPLTAIAGMLTVFSDIFSGKSTGVAGLNKWLTNLIYGAGTYEGNQMGNVTVTPNIPGFADGGIVPGPMGAPQIIMAHGGEEVLTPEDRGIDYERMGEAVAAGNIDAMMEMGSGGPSGSSADLRTKLAQLLYDPLQVEEERRGGTV